MAKAPPALGGDALATVLSFANEETKETAAGVSHAWRYASKLPAAHDGVHVDLMEPHALDQLRSPSHPFRLATSATVYIEDLGVLALAGVTKLRRLRVYVDGQSGASDQIPVLLPFEKLESLEITAYHVGVEGRRDVQSLLQALMPRIKRLTLDCANWGSLVSFADSNITTLSVLFDPVLGHETFVYPPNLTDLEISTQSGIVYVTPNFLSRLPVACPNLKRLHIDGRCVLRGVDLSKTRIVDLKIIVSPRLSHTDAFPQMTWPSELVRLQLHTIGYQGQPIAEMLNCIANQCPALQSLLLADDASGWPAVKVRDIGKLTQLRTLELRQFSPATLEVFKPVAHQLEDLTLGWSQTYDTTYIANFTNAAASLRLLAIDRLDMASIRLLRPTLERISRLEVSSSILLTADGWHEFARLALKLETFKFWTHRALPEDSKDILTRIPTLKVLEYTCEGCAAQDDRWEGQSVAIGEQGAHSYSATITIRREPGPPAGKRKKNYGALSQPER